MPCEDWPPFQVWFATAWVALIGWGLGYSLPRTPMGANAHTLFFFVFVVLLCFTVHLAYARGREATEE